MPPEPHTRPRSRRGPTGGRAGVATGLAGGAVLGSVVLGLVLLLATAGAAAAVGADPEPAVAELVEGRVTRADPEQTYTLYLPAGYRPPEEGTAVPRWPVLLVFDPRGRSRLAAERFVRGAETYGWIVVSSDGTRSDGPWEPNERALRALLPELDHLAVDPRRIYAAGFSGGAHVAWLLGRSGLLAGVVASGGRSDPEWMVDEVPFANFGAAGTLDFNFAGMEEMDAHFAGRGAHHRLETFEGPHAWMPPEMAFEALGWLEVVAMVEGRRPVDRELAGRLLAADLAAAEGMEAAGEPLWAARRYRSILRTYGPLFGPEAPQREADRSTVTTPPDATLPDATPSGTTPSGSTPPDAVPPGTPRPDAPTGAAPDLAAIAERLAAVEGSPAYRTALRERERWDRLESAYRSRLGDALLELQDPQRPMTADRLARRLEVERLQRLAGEGSTIQRRTARRLLATAFVQTAFYLHRDLRSTGQHRKAATVLEVAARIQPGDPVVLYNLACARALAGRPREALNALAQAVDAGFADAEQVRTDPDLEGLRREEGFLVLLERLERAPERAPEAASPR